MDVLKSKKEAAKTEKDFKLTGREIFENKDVKLIGDLKIADEDFGKVDAIEEEQLTAVEDDNVRDEMFYDKALYA
jgi:hypothetical protein